MAKLVKRGSVWYAWVPRPGGGTRLVSTRCTDRRAAEARRTAIERDATDPAHAAASHARTSAILVAYLASRERLGRAAGTLHHVRTKAGHLVRLLPQRAAAVTHGVLLAYVDQRLAEGSRRTTIKKELRVLGAAWRFARRDGLVDRDPGEILPELTDDYAPRTRALSPWELVALAEYLPEHRAAHVVWIVATGARWGESLRARPGDREGAMQRVRGTKTRASARVVPLVGPAVTMMGWAEARTSLPFERWANVRRDLAEACLALGIDPVTPNDLRRTFASWLRAAGVEPQLIGAAMGHVDSRMAERVYGRLTPSALADLLARHIPDTEAVDGHEPSDASADTGRIENPRVGGSIPSLGTESSDESGDGEPPAIASAPPKQTGAPDKYPTVLGDPAEHLECSPVPPELRLARAFRDPAADIIAAARAYLLALDAGRIGLPPHTTLATDGPALSRLREVAS